MSKIVGGLLYTKDHEWVKVEGDVATIGITDFAQGELGDVVFFELTEAGESINAGDSLGTVEAVKAVSEIYSPVSGEIVEINEELTDAPETVNADAFGNGWISKVRITDKAELDELMDADAYKELVG